MSTSYQPNPYWQPGDTRQDQPSPGYIYYPASYPSGVPPYGPPVYVQPVVPVVVAVQPKTNTKALVSLILGVCSYILSAGILTGLPAVILGHMALREIERSEGKEEGRSLAIIGLVLGYIAIVATIIGCAFVAIFILGIFGAVGAATSQPQP